jgi:predicted transcriptional regulator of viral defense system
VCITLAISEGIAHMNIKPDYDQLYNVAESQAGYFTASQARKVGFSWERLSSNVKKGTFLRVIHGVYRLAHFPGSTFEDLFIAWLKTGPRSVISHESALGVYDLSDIIPAEVHVIVPRNASRRHKGIHLHTNQLRPDEIASREGLPVTSVARTIVDVATTHLAEEQIHQAIQEALIRGLVSPKDLRDLAERKKGRALRIIVGTLDKEKAP